MSTYQTTIERNVRGMDCEVDVTVEYTAVPFCRGSTDGRYGPKLSPDEPAHIEIESVRETETGVEIELTTAQERAIEDAIAEDLDEAEAFARERDDDWRREVRGDL